MKVDSILGLIGIIVLTGAIGYGIVGGSEKIYNTIKHRAEEMDYLKKACDESGGIYKRFRDEGGICFKRTCIINLLEE